MRIDKREFKLENYEGPLDLLLELIRNKKMNISEISLLSVVDQFVDLVKNASTINLNEFSEYLLLSAELLAIKSKFILQKESERNIVFEDKKTKNLLFQLIEYEKYKNLSDKIFEIYKNSIHYDKKEDDLDEFVSENTIKNFFLKTHDKEDIENAISNIHKIINERKPLSTTLKVKRISVEQRREQLEKFFKSNESVDFFDLIENDFSIYMISITLLCLLEMANAQIIKITQQNSDNKIYIERL